VTSVNRLYNFCLSSMKKCVYILLCAFRSCTRSKLLHILVSTCDLVPVACPGARLKLVLLLEFLVAIWCDICGARIIFPIHKCPAHEPSSPASLFCVYRQEFSPLDFICAICDFCSQSLLRPTQIHFGHRVLLCFSRLDFDLGVLFSSPACRIRSQLFFWSKSATAYF
jgi:hypothetical protein